ncbi:unnamed protein product, partial [Brassica oleracea]
IRLIYSLLRHCCVSITLSRLKHRQFFTESILRSPIPLFVAGTIVQECGLASSNRYYVIDASLLHYAVSSIDGSSQSWYCDPLTRAAIFYGGWTSCYQNPLVGLFNVDFDFLRFFERGF